MILMDEAVEGLSPGVKEGVFPHQGDQRDLGVTILLGEQNARRHCRSRATVTIKGARKGWVLDRIAPDEAARTNKRNR